MSSDGNVFIGVDSAVGADKTYVTLEHQAYLALKEKCAARESYRIECNGHGDTQKQLAEAQEEIKEYREVLEYCCRVTYGTEFINTDAENNEIIAGHFFNSQKKARETLNKWKRK